MRSVLRFLLHLIMPVVVIVIGAGISVLGLNMDSSFIAMTGLVVIAAGIFWGYLLYDGGLDY